jgi:hypothetical protein
VAAISNDKVSVLWIEGNADRWGVFRIRNFSVTVTSSAADTWDASNYFATVETGTFLVGVTTGLGSVVASTSAVVSLFSTAASTAVSAFVLLRGQASTGYLAGS